MISSFQSSVLSKRLQHILVVAAAAAAKGGMPLLLQLKVKSDGWVLLLAGMAMAEHGCVAAIVAVFAASLEVKSEGRFGVVMV